MSSPARLNRSTKFGPYDISPPASTNSRKPKIVGIFETVAALMIWYRLAFDHAVEQGPKFDRMGRWMRAGISTPSIRPRSRSMARRGPMRLFSGSATPQVRASTPDARVRIIRRSMHSLRFWRGLVDRLSGYSRREVGRNTEHGQELFHAVIGISLQHALLCRYGRAKLRCFCEVA